MNLVLAIIPQHDSTLHHIVMSSFWWETQDSGHLAGEGEQSNTVHNVHYVGHLWPRIRFQREGASSKSLQGTHFFCHPLKLLFWSAFLFCLHPSVWFTKMANESTLSRARICQPAEMQQMCVWTQKQIFCLYLAHMYAFWMMSDLCMGCLSPGGS